MHRYCFCLSIFFNSSKAGQLIDAVECLQEAKALDSTNPEIFYQVALALWHILLNNCLLKEGCMMEMQELYMDSLLQYQKVG